MKLVRYEAARSALQEAATVDEVKDIRDKAIAFEAYAIQAKDTKMLAWATEIKLRAERKAGELLAVRPMNRGEKGQFKNKSFAGGILKVPPIPIPSTLKEDGISKKQSATWQKIAEIPEAPPDGHRDNKTGQDIVR